MWQPIETAPKDGTRIFLGRKGLVTVGHWLDNSRERWPWQGWHTQDGPFGEQASNPLTHWRTLPEPPE